MSLDIKINGADGFLALRIQQAKLDESIRGSIRELGQAYRTRLISELTKTKSGRSYSSGKGAIYRRNRVTVELFGGRSASITKNVGTAQSYGKYRASAPGQSPAQRTGNLVRSIRLKMPPAAKGFGAKIFAHRGLAFYRHFLEFGTAEHRTSAVRKWRKKQTIFSGGIKPRPVYTPLSAQLDRDLSSRVLAAVEEFARGG